MNALEEALQQTVGGPNEDVTGSRGLDVRSSPAVIRVKVLEHINNFPSFSDIISSPNMVQVFSCLTTSSQPKTLEVARGEGMKGRGEFLWRIRKENSMAQRNSTCNSARRNHFVTSSVVRKCQKDSET